MITTKEGIEVKRGQWWRRKRDGARCRVWFVYHDGTATFENLDRVGFSGPRQFQITVANMNARKWEQIDQGTPAST